MIIIVLFAHLVFFSFQCVLLYDSNLDELPLPLCRGAGRMDRILTFMTTVLLGGWMFFFETIVLESLAMQ